MLLLYFNACKGSTLHKLMYVAIFEKKCVSAMYQAKASERKKTLF